MPDATRFRLLLNAAAILLLCLPIPAQAAEADARVALISDIHFNPFDPPALAAALEARPTADWPAIFGNIDKQMMSGWGSDTNYALLQSSLSAFARTAAEADFAIFAGDFLAHTFNAKAADALGASQTDDRVRTLALKTTLFVGDSLAKALPGKPFIVTLGNTDSECGDYRIEPGGDYLAGTRDMVRRLAGAHRLADDFDRTYTTGGYYSVRHPTLDDTVILVLNDILWSKQYQDACGDDGDATAAAMMDWLGNNLERQRIAGGTVWLVHHMPWGVDALATVWTKQADCAARVVSFRREPFDRRFNALLRRYGTMIRTGFGGHIHSDDYRVVLDAASRPLITQKIIPAISPIYRQNPGFQIVAYDPASAAPTDLTTYYLTNLDRASLAVPGDWRFEYAFSDTYDPAGYTAEGVNALINAVAVDGSVAASYQMLHQVSHDPLPQSVVPSLVCSITQLDTHDFTQCYCGG